MLCESFEKLTPKERSTYIGELAHAVMNDEDCWLLGNAIIEGAKAKGIFDTVKILPQDGTDG
jgi:hypothetical protein